MKQYVTFANRALLFFVILLAVSSAFAQKKAAPDALAEVTALLDAQISAWTAGTPNKATSIYYDSPEMLWVGRNGIRKGYEPIRASYQRTSAQAPRAANYTYETLHLEQLSRDCIFFVIKWRFEQSGRSPMSGVSSMLWKRINKKWVVTVEAAS